MPRLRHPLSRTTTPLPTHPGTGVQHNWCCRDKSRGFTPRPASRLRGLRVSGEFVGTDATEIVVKRLSFVTGHLVRHNLRVIRLWIRVHSGTVRAHERYIPAALSLLRWGFYPVINSFPYPRLSEGKEINKKTRIRWFVTPLTGVLQEFCITHGCS